MPRDFFATYGYPQPAPDMTPEEIAAFWAGVEATQKMIARFAEEAGEHWKRRRKWRPAQEWADDEPRSRRRAPPPPPPDVDPARELAAAYAQLVIKPGCNARDARRAYRRAALACHPDRGGSSGAMVKLNAAWDLIRKTHGWR